VAAREVAQRQSGLRVQTQAMMSWRRWIRAFNEMTHDLEANSRELERGPAQFTEAISKAFPPA